MQHAVRAQLCTLQVTQTGAPLTMTASEGETLKPSTRAWEATARSRSVCKWDKWADAQVD